MRSPIKGIFDRMRARQYGRRQPLILINGLAEQQESWFRNRRFWGRYFDVLMPNLLAYEGDALHRKIAAGEPITVDYLVSQLHTYLDQFVQAPPYHLVSSSLGGKVAVDFAVKYPHLVSRVVLICPSGMGDTEQLPIMEGIRSRDPHGMVRSVFHKPRVADRNLLRYYKAKFPLTRWKKGFVKTVRGTLEYTVRDKMKLMPCPTLLVTGAQDKICCPRTAEEAARELTQGHFRSIPKCGHAPQIEKHKLINRLVMYFLTDPHPTAHPTLSQLLLAKPPREAK